MVMKKIFGKDIKILICYHKETLIAKFSKYCKNALILFENILKNNNNYYNNKLKLEIYIYSHFLIDNKFISKKIFCASNYINKLQYVSSKNPIKSEIIKKYKNYYSMIPIKDSKKYFDKVKKKLKINNFYPRQYNYNYNSQYESKYINKYIIGYQIIVIKYNTIHLSTIINPPFQ